MVNSVAPGALGVSPLNAFAAEQRHTRVGAGVETLDDAGKSDSVSLTRAPLASSRESVREALRQVDLARDLARDAQTLLVTAQSAVRGEASQSDLDQAFATYARKVDVARADGGVLLAGEDVTVQAEPGAGALVIGGVDLQLKASPSDAGIIQLSLSAKAEDAATAGVAQASLDRLQAVVGRLSESAKALEAHDRLLGAAETAIGVRGDITADTARLMALQVRQGLEQAPGVSIANADPQSVLALFRA